MKKITIIFVFLIILLSGRESFSTFTPGRAPANSPSDGGFSHFSSSPQGNLPSTQSATALYSLFSDARVGSYKCHGLVRGLYGLTGKISRFKRNRYLSDLIAVQFETLKQSYEIIANSFRIGKPGAKNYDFACRGPLEYMGKKWKLYSWLNQTVGQLEETLATQSDQLFKKLENEEEDKKEEAFANFESNVPFFQAAAKKCFGGMNFLYEGRRKIPFHKSTQYKKDLAQALQYGLDLVNDTYLKASRSDVAGSLGIMCNNIVQGLSTKYSKYFRKLKNRP